ncbi:MAG: uncharacterized protein JWO79_2792 [Actinomycetia bacterium]|nr:uncharacterized protein [Actinomycetes bacterium]
MIGWLDCAAGASGDMFLGALADAGVPIEVLQDAVDSVGLPERIVLRAEPVTRHGIGGTRVHVDAPPSVTTRTWRDVRALLPDDERAHDAFARLAHAEATVHRTDPEDVHFHEVGGLDAIADVVAASAGIRHLGLTALHASRVTLGSGTSRGQHGRIPIPAPAVLALLAEAGAPVHGGPAEFEMCTPTGAALLAAHVSQWGPLPAMTVRATGNGAGGRDLPELPNLLRLVLGEPVSRAPLGEAVVLEANVDDLDPRLWPPVLAALLDAGASDAWLTPILMKKGRPAHTLHVLASPDRMPQVRAAVFTHTSTIGLRIVTVSKHALDRETASITVGGHPIRIKLARDSGALVNASIEYEDAATAATALGLPVKVVLARATAAAADAGLLP